MKLIHRALALMTLGAVAQITYGQAVDKPEFEWQKEVPAGPFSTINTSSGTLTTRVPLLSLKCLGDTSIDFAVSHMSRPSQVPNSRMQVARGWFSNYHEYVEERQYTPGFIGADTIRYLVRGSGLGRLGTWGRNFNPNYPMAAGTRESFSWTGNSADPYVVTTRNKDLHYEYASVPNAYGGSPFRYLKKIRDKAGRAVNFTYTNGRLTSVTDPTNRRKLNLIYRASDSDQKHALELMELVIDNVVVRTWEFRIDPATGRLMQIKFPRANTGMAEYTNIAVSFNYDSNNNLSNLIDKDGHTWYFRYDSSKRCDQVTVPDSLEHDYPTQPKTTLKYLNEGFENDHYGINRKFRRTEITDAKNRKTIHRYLVTPPSDDFNAKDPIAEVIDPLLPSQTTPYSEKYDWDLHRCTLSWIQNRNGYRTFYDWDSIQSSGPNSSTLFSSFGNVLQKRVGRDLTHVAQSFWTYEYNDKNRVTRENTPTGGRTDYEYSAPGYLGLLPTKITVKDEFTGIAKQTENTYDSNARLISTKSGTDPVSTLGDFDPLSDQPRNVVATNGATTLTTFDNYGRMTSQQTSPQGLWQWEYDHADNKLIEHQPQTGSGGSTRRSVYSNAGRVVTVYDSNGYSPPRKATSNSYDEQGRLYKTTQYVDSTLAKDIVITTKFDEVGDAISVKDGEGKETFYTYDARHHLRTISYTDGTTRQYAYDGNGNRTSSTDGMGRTVTSVYGWTNKPVSFSSGSNYQVSFTFKTDGQLHTVQETALDGGPQLNFTTTYNYSAAGQLRSKEVTNLPTIFFGYDLSGRRSRVTVGAQIWNYVYANGVLDQITQTLGSPVAVKYAYNNDGSIASRVFGNGTSVEYGYDSLGRLVRTSHYKGSGLSKILEDEVTNTLDGEGNVLTSAQWVLSGNSAHSTFEYDWANRLLRETRRQALGGPIMADTMYTYDRAQNRTGVSRLQSGGSWVTSAYSLGTNDRFLSGDGYSFSNYDGNGSPRSIVAPNGSGGTEQMTLTYNRGQLVGLTRAGMTTNYGYDYTGNRVVKGTGSNLTWYIRDESNEVFAEYNTATSSISRYTLPAVCDITPNGTETYLRENPQGSTIATTTTGGARVGGTKFDAWGRVLEETGTQTTPMRYGGYNGYYTDAESGLILSGLRFYIPSLGRFLTHDPAGHTASLNLYAYCDNNPLRRTDPNGTDYHELSRMIVHPNFKGKVWIGGEVQPGGVQRGWWVGPGEMSDLRMDVDWAMVTQPDGTVSIYNIGGSWIGTGGNAWYEVKENGDVTFAPRILQDIPKGATPPLLAYRERPGFWAKLNPFDRAIPPFAIKGLMMIGESKKNPLHVSYRPGKIAPIAAKYIWPTNKK